MCILNQTNKFANLIPFAMACLGLAILLPDFFHPATRSGKDLSDGLRGLLFGVSIGINLMAAWRAARQRRSGAS
ncbi:MAG: hypothetical protein WAM78_20400 [Candidatus Sulfotelmatobacter sp.]